MELTIILIIQFVSHVIASALLAQEMLISIVSLVQLAINKLSIAHRRTLFIVFLIVGLATMLNPHIAKVRIL